MVKIDLKTPSMIATEAGVALHRVMYLLKYHQPEIKPDHLASNRFRMYGPKKVKQIIEILNSNQQVA